MNIEKTVILWFKNKSSSNLTLDCINIDGLKLECATFAKFLGLWINNYLNWREHVRRLILKLSSRRSLLCRGKNLLTVHAKKVLYYAQIHSNLSYGLLIWGNMITCEDKQKLQKIQNKCIQLIDVKMSVEDIYREYKILNLTQMIDLENYKVWFKHYHNKLPAKFSKLMSEDRRSLVKEHRYNTRRKNEINSPLATANRYQSSFLVKGFQTYSKLPLEIKNDSNYNHFIHKCKQYLFANNM